MTPPRDRTARERKRRQRERQRAERERRRAEREPLTFERQDWTLFTDPETLPQKAGVSRRLLVALALKELVDNALDAAPAAGIARDDQWWRVADNGPGLGRDQIERLFRVNRGMVSSKLLRRPTRGALGNGLRVAVGAVIASRGEMEVHSRGEGYRLAFRPDGSTAAEPIEALPGDGTTVRVAFGHGLVTPADADAWARLAIALNRRIYDGPSSPHWYDPEAFRRLLQAAPADATVADVLGAMGITINDPRPARGLDPDAAHGVLVAAQRATAPVTDLGAVGGDALECGSYARRTGEYAVGDATMPATVEAWATAELCQRSKAEAKLTVCANRTPAPAEITSYFYNRRLYVTGAGLNYHCIDGVPATARYRITVNLLAPHVPLTSDGKTPDLDPLRDLIATATVAACKSARRKASLGRKRVTIKDAAYEIMEEAYNKAGGRAGLPVKPRQIMYAAREHILRRTGNDKLDDHRFTQRLLPRYLRDYPEETADWDIVYDARGNMIEPHTKRVVPLGTLEVRQYLGDRPDFGSDGPTGFTWPTSGPRHRYSTVLFIEKEGFEPLLQKVRLAERNDIAIMSTKGMSVTAARLLLDRLAAKHDIKVLVARDFDISGFSIFGTLAGDTERYTYDNEVAFIDIGLRLADVRAWGLQDEPVKPEDFGAKVPTLLDYGATEEEIDFLSDRRVELNAFASDQFVQWLEGKLEEHGVSKVVPDGETLTRAFRKAAEREYVAAAMPTLTREAERKAARLPGPSNLDTEVRRMLEADPELSWDDAVARLAAREATGAGP